ncbi:MAG TPA: dienelactone hydrolase family protein, partial [Candidatus Acidoferrum sp.]|nr:dienelactone hydrolase family protein [Candidatus Acidoferrum sp.]
MKPFVITGLLIAAFAANAQEWAKAKLDKSSRHQEWVKIENGKRKVDSFVVYPEVKEKATAVIVIHEIFGLSDWARSVTDQFAEAGYIAIAPDLLSGMGPNGGGTKELGSDANKAISTLPPDQITADLNAVAAYVSKLPACNGKVVVAGFCWGGGQTFRFATNNKDIKAGLSFYGSMVTDEAAAKRMSCPIYGFYGENDNRINSQIPKAEELIKKAGKTYEPVIYKGAGHGFMRAGEQPDANEANKKARDDAWVRIK